MSVVSFFLIANPQSVKADYEGARLIDNQLYLDAKSMTKNQVRSFLENKNSGLADLEYELQCYGPSSKERQWYENAGAECDTLLPAADIIYYAAQIYGISPKVVLATLQKEQGLVTDPSPNSWQLDQAMGYACPSSGGCSSSTFPYQIDAGTWALRYHYERANKNYDWWTPSNGYWVCGSEKNYYKPNLYPNQRVYFYDGDGVRYRIHRLSNAATSAMYCYTPHAYNNFPDCKPAHGVSYASWKPTYGFKGMCYSGSYNFVSAYEAWFGSTKFKLDYVPMQTSRWMQTKNDIRKTNVRTDEPIDEVIPAGTQLYFPTKVSSWGKTYLRTQHDTDMGYEKGILLSGLEEVNITYEPMTEPRWLEVSYSTYKMIPREFKDTGPVLQEGLQIFFDEKTSVGGTTYLRTRHDTENGFDTAIPLWRLQETNIAYEPFKFPRWMKTKEATFSYDIKNTESVGSEIAAATDLYFDKKIRINNKTYATEGPKPAGTFVGISLELLEEIDTTFEPMKSPRAYKLSEDLYKVDPQSSEPVDTILSQDLEVYFTTKIRVGGQTYLRTLHDTRNGYLKGIPLSKLDPVNVNFEPMVYPRSLKMKEMSYKLDPVTGQTVDDYALHQGREIEFSEKITIDDMLYLRTSHDTENKNFKVIPYSLLEEISD